MRCLLETIKPLFLILLIIFSLGSTAFGLDDAIIGVINDELITLSDLRKYVQSTYITLTAQGVPKKDIKAIMQDLKINGVEKLIEDKLILSKANEIGLEINDQVVESRINELKANYESEQKFTESLIDNGATISDLQKKIADELKIKYIIEHFVRSKIYVNPQEVTRFYENNPKDFERGEKAQLKSIYVAYGKDQKEAKQRIQEAVSELNEGISFDDVAQKYSDTPSIGIVERGQLLPEIEETVFAMETGQTSDPLELESGIYIFHLISKIPPQMAKIEEVKNEIYHLLFMKKFKKSLSEWLMKLKEEAFIEIKIEK